MERIEQDEWTPKIVGEELTEAVRWAYYAGGRVGPAGYGSGMPAMMMNYLDRLAEGWDIVADQEPVKKSRRFLAPDEVSRAERVLMWQATYLGTAPAAAEALSIWVLCKIKRGVRYVDVLDRKGIARATAYRRRDRALSIIATGLTRDGIPRGKH